MNLAGCAVSGIVTVGIPFALTTTVGKPSFGAWVAPFAPLRAAGGAGETATTSATKTISSFAPTPRSVEPVELNASDGGMAPTTREPTAEHFRVLTRPGRYLVASMVNGTVLPSNPVFVSSLPVVPL